METWRQTVVPNALPLTPSSVGSHYEGVLKGESEQEFEEVADDQFDCTDGISKLSKELEVSFGERETFHQGGTIREFENIGRYQGESASWPTTRCSRTRSRPG